MNKHPYCTSHFNYQPKFTTEFDRWGISNENNDINILVKYFELSEESTDENNNHFHHS